MKTLFTAIVTVLALSSCFSSHNYGPKVERDYALESFTAILGKGIGEIQYKQGDAFAVHVEGDSIQVENSIVEVKDGALIIDRKPGSEKIGNEGVTYFITAPSITQINMDGVVAFETKEPVTLPNDLAINLDGVGALKMKNLTCHNLGITNSGVGAMEISVSCQDATCDIQGVGAIDLNIQGESLKLKTGGVGAVKLSGHVNSYQKDNDVSSPVDDDKLKVGNE